VRARFAQAGLNFTIPTVKAVLPPEGVALDDGVDMVATHNKKIVVAAEDANKTEMQKIMEMKDPWGFNNETLSTEALDDITIFYVDKINDPSGASKPAGIATPECGFDADPFKTNNILKNNVFVQAGESFKSSLANVDESGNETVVTENDIMRRKALTHEILHVLLDNITHLNAIDYIFASGLYSSKISGEYSYFNFANLRLV